MLIAGFILKFDSGLLEAEVIELFNRVIVSNIPLGTLADANAYMMIISGGIIMFIAILGLCGAWKNIKGCLWAVSKTRLLRFSDYLKNIKGSLEVFIAILRLSEEY